MCPSRLHFGDADAADVFPLIKQFHYSRRLPANVQHCFVMRESGGLFGEHGKIVAACLFSIPPTRWSEPVLELSRLVRADDVEISLTGLIGKAVKFMAKQHVDLLVSFADKTQGHHGGIYQAASWDYAGCRERRMDGVMIDGVFWPGRSLNSRYGTQSPVKLRERFPEKDIEPHFDEGKHLYWKAADKAGKRKAKRLGLKSLPYVKPDFNQSVEAVL